MSVDSLISYLFSGRLTDASYHARVHSVIGNVIWSKVGFPEQGRFMNYLIKTIAVMFLLYISLSFAQTQQEHVHHMSHSVMPFDMSETIHIFKMTEEGGIQRVISRNDDAVHQIMLIQQHLKHEAEKFKRGDYSDPLALHGPAMPGLKELQAAGAGINIAYADLPLGGQITFETTSLHLLTAIHRWFGAQLSEHGADAKAE